MGYFPQKIISSDSSCPYVFVVFFLCNSNFGIFFSVDRNLKKLQQRTHIETEDKDIHLPPGDGRRDTVKSFWT